MGLRNHYYKARGGDGIPAQSFQILKDNAISAALIMPANLENSATATGLKFSFRSQRRAMPKNLHYCTTALISHASMVMLKILQIRSNSM